MPTPTLGAVTASAPTGAALWIAGARPKTLPAAVVPVAVGTAVAVHLDAVVWWRAALALLVSLALQVATNYVNDYADGERGTDDDRVGPLRLVGGGHASARSVKIAAAVAFAVAGLAGAVLAVAVGPELFVVGAASMLAGWAYTGGPRPYGYLGLGEVFVFVFFGVVATVGTTYVQTETLPGAAWTASVGVGALAVALLVTNNLRDRPLDELAGKHTLAVRIGDANSRRFFVALFVVVAGAVVATAAQTGPAALLGLVGLVPAITPIRTVLGGATGLDLIPVLAGTGRVQLAVAITFALGIVLVT